MPANNGMEDNVIYVEYESKLGPEAYWPHAEPKPYPQYDPDPESEEAHEQARVGSLEPVTERSLPNLGHSGEDFTKPTEEPSEESEDSYESLTRNEMRDALDEAGIDHGLPKNGSRLKYLEAYKANFDPPVVSG